MSSNIEQNQQLVAVTQIRSSAGRSQKQKGTLNGLGLRRIGHRSILKVTPEIMGMIDKVSHLIKFEFVSAEPGELAATAAD